MMLILVVLSSTHLSPISIFWQECLGPIVGFVVAEPIILQPMFLGFKLDDMSLDLVACRDAGGVRVSPRASEFGPIVSMPGKVRESLNDRLTIRHNRRDKALDGQNIGR